VGWGRGRGRCAKDEAMTDSFHIRDRSLFIPGVGFEEIWVG
jgi:hypothetical protein